MCCATRSRFNDYTKRHLARAFIAINHVYSLDKWNVWRHFCSWKRLSWSFVLSLNIQYTAFSLVTCPLFLSLPLSSWHLPHGSIKETKNSNLKKYYDIFSIVLLLASTLTNKQRKRKIWIFCTFTLLCAMTAFITWCQCLFDCFCLVVVDCI